MLKNVSIISLFEQQVKENGEKTALKFRDTSWSYKQLDKKSNQLARILKSKGIGEHTLVGIYLERSMEMLTAILGILKAGAAYVPLDYTHPAERNKYILKQSDVKLILTEKKLAEYIADGDIETLCIEKLDNLAEGEGVDALDIAINPEMLCYVMYTSGSTGKPKGVAVKHGGVANYLESIRKRLDISGEERAVATITITFDISVTEIFVPLTTGGTLVIADQETVKDGVKLRKLMEKEEINLFQTTPSFIYMLKEAGWKGNEDLTIAIGGEAWSIELAKELLGKGMCKTLWNFYGPTETTIFSSVAKITMENEYIPLGEPIDHTQLYVLDEEGMPVGVGEKGELYIGGAGVAKGYFNNEILTKERFIKNPFEGESQYIYKTGDIVKRVDKQSLMYVGRVDFQVKIRGYRIELGEIEKALLKIPYVIQAVVVAEGEENNMSLSAYLRAEGNQVINTQEIRYLLEQLLPAYMIPNYFIQVDKYPMTPNGKVDRRALITLGQQNRQKQEYIPPRTEIEEEIERLWEELLEIKHISVVENFLQLGGHSLMANRLVVRMNKIFNTDLTLLDILTTNLTIEDMARAVEDNLLGNLSEEELQSLLNEVGE